MTVANGELVISTQREKATCAFAGAPAKEYDWTSGWVDTHFKFATPGNGMVEIRAALPPAWVRRIWPAAWLLDFDNKRDTGFCWPLSTEADIYEMTGGLGTSPICGSVHWGYECNVDKGDAFQCAPRPDDGFHTYGIRFTPDAITWYLDGVVTGFNGAGFNGQNFLLKPNAIILNTAISTALDGEVGPFPEGGAKHRFDWIRVRTRWAVLLRLRTLPLH